MNLGLILTRPFESYYAFFRHCLISNPGNTYLSMRKAIDPNAFSAEQLTVYEKRSHQSLVEILSSDMRFSRIYPRQCPVCAARYYHSYIYSFPWLEVCPIHHVPFTLNCPACHNPWPNLKSLHRNTCGICGIPSINQLEQISLIKDYDDEYRSIEDVYRLLYKPNSAVTIVADSPVFYSQPNWWTTVPVTARQFGAYLAKITKTSRNFNSCIRHYPILRKNTGLSEIKEQNDKNKPIFSSLEDEFDQGPDDRFSDCEYKVTARIANFMLNAIPEHVIHINSYRYIEMSHNFIENPPCPYCMAFSIWFYNVMARKYGIITQWNINSYPFLDSLGIKLLNVTSDPIISTTSTRYTCEENFCKWFYTRGLEIAFVYLLINIASANTLLRKKIDCKPLEVTNYGGYYMCLCSNNRANYYYKKEHPIEDISTSIPIRKNSCTSFIEYSNPSDGTPQNIGHIESKYTRKKHIELENDFKKFLRLLISSYN